MQMNTNNKCHSSNTWYNYVKWLKMKILIYLIESKKTQFGFWGNNKNSRNILYIFFNLFKYFKIYSNKFSSLIENKFQTVQVIAEYFSHGMFRGS